MSQAAMEAEIFKHCMPFGQSPASGVIKAEESSEAQQSGQKRQRQQWPVTRRHGRTHPQPHPHHPQSYHAHQGPPLQDPTVNMMGKLLLKHEAFLANLRKDMGYMLFFRQDERSVLPALMEVARVNREKQEAGSTEVQSPLRTLLLNCLLKELLQRAQQIAATEEGRSSLQQAQWMTKEGHWNYMRWNAQQRRLLPDARREPLTHENAIRTITELQSQMSGEIVHRFQSTQSLYRIEDEGHQQATFSLIISLRHPSADDVHSGFGVLQGNALTGLVGMSMKKDDIPQQHLAKMLAQEIYRSRAVLLMPRVPLALPYKGTLMPKIGLCSPILNHILRMTQSSFTLRTLRTPTHTSLQLSMCLSAPSIPCQIHKPMPPQCYFPNSSSKTQATSATSMRESTA